MHQEDSQSQKDAHADGVCIRGQEDARGGGWICAQSPSGQGYPSAAESAGNAAGDHEYLSYQSQSQGVGICLELGMDTHA